MHTHLYTHTHDRIKVCTEYNLPIPCRNRYANNVNLAPNNTYFYIMRAHYEAILIAEIESKVLAYKQTIAKMIISHSA